MSFLLEIIHPHILHSFIVHHNPGPLLVAFAHLFLIFSIYLFILLFSALGLSCGRQDSLVEVLRLSSCSAQA